MGMEHNTSSSEFGNTGPKPLGHIDEWADLALDYIEGRLDAHRFSLVEHHISSCAPCRERLEEQRWIAGWAASVRPAEPPPDMESRVMAALHPHTERPSWLASADTTYSDALVPVSPAARTAGPENPAHDASARERRRAARGAPVPSWAERLRSLFQPRNLAIAGAIIAVVMVGTITFRSQQTAMESIAGARQATSTAAAVTQVPASGDQEQAPSPSEAPVAPTPSSAGVQPTTTAADISLTTTTNGYTLTSAGVTKTSPATTGQTTDGTLTSEPMVSSSITGAPEPLWVAFSRDDTSPEVTAAGFQEITGLSPLPQDHWMGGPTFAVVASVHEVAALLDSLHQHGFRAEASKQPIDVLGNAVNLILAGFTSYPVISLSAGAIRTSHVSYATLPPRDQALLVFFTSR